jgi:hypothetical protein
VPDGWGPIPRILREPVRPSGQIQGDRSPLSAPVALLQGMLRDLAEEEPADENSRAASQDHMNGPRRRDLAGPAAPSDAAIIERSVAVSECFAEIFDRHAAGIYRYAARRLGRQAAADVMYHQRSQCFSYSATDRDRDTGSMNRVMVDATHNGLPSALSTINQLITGETS